MFHLLKLVKKIVKASHIFFVIDSSFFRENSGDENERIMMIKSGLSHNDYYQTAEEVSLLNVITIFLKLVQKEIIYL